jgi:hypothetical protein
MFVDHRRVEAVVSWMALVIEICETYLCREINGDRWTCSQVMFYDMVMDDVFRCK